MSRRAARVLGHGLRKLAPAAQAKLDELAAVSRLHAARTLGVTAMTIERLRYGGRANADACTRIEAAVAAMGAPCGE